MFEVTGEFTHAKIMIEDIEAECLSQIYHFISHEAFTNPIAIMPDTHSGKGSVIGFTMPISDKVVPNVIGVDIGCGMLSFCIGNKLPISLELLDHRIRNRIPFGVETHEESMINMEKEFPWKNVNVLAQKFTLSYQRYSGIISDSLPDYSMNWFLNKAEKIGGTPGKHLRSIGTFGGGNHFLETGVDLNNNYWITIHTGSRNFGKRICDYWQGIAKKELEHKVKGNKKEIINELKQRYSGDELYKHIKELKDETKATIDMKGCEYLMAQNAFGYLYDMLFSQVYAMVNRHKIKEIILDILGKPLVEDEIETVHNFIDFKDMIIRKGAIRSYEGERMIIPFNMRDGILVCEGKSNPEWNYSAPHGAGRVMSRSRAKKEIDLEKFVEQMKGIHSSSVGMGTLDEAPDAYKDSKVIEDAISPTAKILNRIKPIHNMKDKVGQSDD